MQRIVTPLLFGIGVTLLLAMMSAPVLAQTEVEDPLHGFCWEGPACPDNGTNAPTSTNPPQFGFTISPGPQTGDYLIDILVPNNVSSASSFGITGTQGGSMNTSPIAGTATLFSSTAWTSGFLAGYLGISASPSNPVGAYLPSTQTLDAGATGFFVFQADLGTNRLFDNPNGLSGPLLDLSVGLPQGSYIVGFLNTSSGIVATANSGAIFETSLPTPEPASLLLLGTGLVAFGGMLRHRSGQAGA